MTEKTLSVKDFKVVDVFPSGRDVLQGQTITTGLSGKLSNVTSTDHYGQYPEFHKAAHLSDYIKDGPTYKGIQSPMAGKPWTAPDR